MSCKYCVTIASKKSLNRNIASKICMFKFFDLQLQVCIFLMHAILNSIYNITFQYNGILVLIAARIMHKSMSQH